jgi:hypothetical protein
VIGCAAIKWLRNLQQIHMLQQSYIHLDHAFPQVTAFCQRHTGTATTK